MTKDGEKPTKEGVGIVAIRQKVNVEALEILRDLTGKVERREVTGISVIYENSNGTYSTAESSTLSRLQTVGAPMDLVVGRLGYIRGSEGE